MKKSGIIIILTILTTMLAYCSGNDKDQSAFHPYCNVSGKVSSAETDAAADAAFTDGANSPFSHYGFASIYGKFYNGLDGSVLNSKSDDYPSLPFKYSIASPTVRIFSASSSGISISNFSSNAMTSSTVSSESAPRSSMNEASGLT